MNTASLAQVSVITCSHDPRKEYLQHVIESLKNQTLDKQNWEYLLIDNASNDPLEPRVDLKWHPNARHVREEKLGLTYARLRGIREARGELLVFVDDDNILDPDYLERSLEIGVHWPMLGAWSGQTIPEFETSPPEWTNKFWGNLAIRRLSQDSWSNLPNLPETMPCGAGLCVRREVGEQYVRLHESGKRNFVMDRKGNSLISAGDNDLAACSCDVGLGVGLFVALKLTHLIPADRLTESYLLRLVEGVSYSGVIFRSFRSPDRNTQRLTTKLADLARQAFMDPRERRFFRAWRRGESRAVQDLSPRSGQLNNTAPLTENISSSIAKNPANSRG
jgi:glycosyltransferase involved in cell wall biosynthesis